jgi:hypothetical protein
MLASTPLAIVVVRYELNVIILRQEIRLLARRVGLPPCQQARITAAASTLARAFLAHELEATFWVRPLADCGVEVVCAPLGAADDGAGLSLQALVDLEQTRLLVNEVQLAQPPEGPRLTMRIWA